MVVVAKEQGGTVVGRAIAGDRAGRGRRGGALTPAEEDSASFGFLQRPAIVACHVNSFLRARLADELKDRFILCQRFRSRVRFCNIDCLKIMLEDLIGYSDGIVVSIFKIKILYFEVEIFISCAKSLWTAVSIFTFIVSYIMRN